MTELNKRQMQALKGIVGEKQIEIAKTYNISLNRLLHLYHKTGRNPTEFKEAINDFFSEHVDEVSALTEQIDNLRKQTEKMEKVREGLLQDYLLENVGELK